MEKIKSFLNEDQDPKAIEKIVAKLKDLTTSTEEIMYIAVQKKPAVNISPESIALTNKRIIFFKPKNFGLSMDFEDLLWKDVKDCHMKEGIMGATFTVTTLNGRGFFLDYLPKSQARLLYRFAQEREEEMAEHRRLRELEHVKAAAGGIVIHNDSKPAPVQTETVSKVDDPMESLKKLKQLLENDLISQEEFDAKKAEIISKL